MPELINLLMTVTFIGVWVMIGSELVARHSRETKPRQNTANDRQSHSHFRS